MEIAKSTFLDTMEEVLYEDCLSDYITKSEMRDYLKDIKKFIRHAKDGDEYWYAGSKYVITEC